MSRKLTALLLAMLVLVGAMGLKTVVTAHSNGTVMMANGGGPWPPAAVTMANGGGPWPPAAVTMANGGGPWPPQSVSTK